MIFYLDSALYNSALVTVLQTNGQSVAKKQLKIAI